MAFVIVMLPSIEVIDSPTSVDFIVLRTQCLFVLIHSLLGLTNLPWASFFSDEEVESHHRCQQLHSRLQKSCNMQAEQWKTTIDLLYVWI